MTQLEAEQEIYRDGRAYSGVAVLDEVSPLGVYGGNLSESKNGQTDYLRKLKVNSRLYKRKLGKKVSKEGIIKYMSSELPGDALSFFSGVGTSEAVKVLTGSNLCSSLTGMVAGDLGFFVGKSSAFTYLHRDDYLNGKGSASQDVKNIAKSVGVAMAFDLAFVALPQYALQRWGGLDPLAAASLVGAIGGCVSTGARWGIDYAKGLAGSRLKKVKDGGLEEIVSEADKN